MTVAAPSGPAELPSPAPSPAPGQEPSPTPRPERPERLGQRDLLAALRAYVRRRVPASDVDDIVQGVLCEALAARRIPEADSALAAWLIGIARHEIADAQRRAARVSPQGDIEAGAAPADDAAIEARELAEWAVKRAQTLSGAGQTLAWMAREGDGDRIETIAEEEKVPAPRIRQRVSRLRRLLREHWRLELAACALVALGVALGWLARGPFDGEGIARSRGQDARSPVLPDPDAARPAGATRTPALPTPAASPSTDAPNASPQPTPPPDASPESHRERGAELRQRATDECARGDFFTCLRTLDEAHELDPEGGGTATARTLRSRAKRAILAAEAAEATPAKRALDGATGKPKAPMPSPIVDPFGSTAKPKAGPQGPGY